MSSLSISLSSSLRSHPKVNQLAGLLATPKNGSPGLTVNVHGQESALITLNVARSIVIAALLSVLNAAKEFARDGVFHDVELAYLDTLAEYPGFGEAMVAVGWVKYDKKKKRITLCFLTGNQQAGAAKKSPGAIRQERYRRRQRLKQWIARSTMAVSGKHGPKYNPANTVVEFTYDERGAVTSFGSIIIDGVEMKVEVSQPQRGFYDERRSRRSVTIEGISVTHPVTHGDSGVTRSVTHPVTHGDSGVTYHIPCSPSRVIPSRARTRLSFLRSKTLRSKHKTTHSAREKIFMAVFKTKTAHGQNPTWAARSGHPRQKPVSLSEPRNSPETFDALLNVTQSVALWRNGQSAACVSQKTRHAAQTQLPEQSVIEPGKFRLFSDWSPSADFLANAQHIGLKLSHEATDYEVAEFISYWSEEGAQHTQKQWETKLARFIGKGRKRAAKRASGRQDFTIPTSMDYAIPDGFHGG